MDWSCAGPPRSMRTARRTASPRTSIKAPRTTGPELSAAAHEGLLPLGGGVDANIYLTFRGPITVRAVLKVLTAAG